MACTTAHIGGGGRSPGGQVRAHALTVTVPEAADPAARRHPLHRPSTATSAPLPLTTSSKVAPRASRPCATISSAVLAWAYGSRLCSTLPVLCSTDDVPALGPLEL
ncbi:hypothetical protein F751_5168 [Auxenochlorella protothecoides]|uniref:Uncharacterized protein n=1 Tax=Auxenochlorella protothecoides TaxID=3075 RepID=A0A087SQQ3_AUXPR|nr:hypothetical protein F751_5168 [Auxenochlorella protothecoides]KFM28057.1 hypothetical protein F751_5168 [Auxenochlorella protothecoides]